MQFPYIASDFNVNSAIESLRRYGLPTPVDDHVRNGLKIGLMHESFLYEHASEIPAVTPGYLAALGSLGKAFTHRAAVLYPYQRMSFAKPGPLSDRVAYIASSFHRWAGDLGWLSQSVALSKGLDRTALPQRVSSIVCHQVIGVLCVSCLQDVADSLLLDLIRPAFSKYDLPKFDPRTLLQQALGQTPLDTRVEQSGPDHASTFVVTLTDARARHSRGEGRSKKQATQAASADFLRRYIPSAIAGADRTSKGYQSPEVDPLPIEGPAYHRHMAGVSRVRELFSLPVTAAGLLSQALIHSSWTYENRLLVARTHQQDNQVLGLVGSHILNYEHILRVVRSRQPQLPVEFTFLTMERRSLERAFYHLGLRDALVMGQGQSSLGVSLEMASNAFQAVMAAIFLSKQCPASLLDEWPERLSRLRDIAIQEVPRSQDSVTTLQEICAISQLIFSYSVELSGPSHSQTSRSTLTLDSQLMRRRIKLVGGSVQGGKKPANQEVASIVLEIMDTLADKDSILGLSRLNSNDVRLAAYLLAHFAASTPGPETLIRKWMNARLFGTHLARVPSALAEWADAADSLLGQQDALPDGAAITRLYRSAIAITADQSSPIRHKVAAMLRRIESLGAPEDVGQQDISELALLCDVYRTRGSEMPNVTVGSLVEDWSLLYGARVQVSSDVPRTTLTGSQRGALDSLVSLLLSHSRAVAVEVADGTPIEIRMHGDTGPTGDLLATACSLWSATDPMLSVTLTERGVDLTVTPITSDGDPGLIRCSVEAALRPIPEPDSNAVADLLHDLKNQLIAAKQALAVATNSRTAQLAARAFASGHLDQAVAMGRRLGAVSSLLGPPGAEATELRSFMRQYSMAVLSRLPDTISLVLPSTAGDSVTVALDEASLTAILDNLVKNSVEAMPLGGSIKLEWASDSKEAAIEVSDDGPGLPDAIAYALESGAPVASTKTGGNGLGLRSVKTLLRRAGGELTVSNTSGTAWLLSIPLSIEVDAPEEN